MSNAPLRVLLLSDGRPGHFNLSEGIAAALARRRPVKIARLEVRRGRWPGDALAALTNVGLSPAWMLKAVYGIVPANLPQIDVVVSAGAETLAANIACARLLARPNVFYGSLRQFRAESFALVLTSYPRNAGRPHHALALKPASFDPDAFPGHPRSAPGLAGPHDVGLLIGGNAPGVSFAAEDWSRLVDVIQDVSQQTGKRWIISNSRRSDPAISDRLAAIAADPAGPIRQFIDVRRPPAPPLVDLFARVDAVLCTAELRAPCCPRRSGPGCRPSRWRRASSG